MINKQWMYEDGVCRMCEGSEGNHVEGCPGDVIENLRYEVTYSGPHCGRGCCGYTDGSVQGNNLEECVTKAAALLTDTISQSCEARMVFTLWDEDVTGLVQEALKKLRTANS